MTYIFKTEAAVAEKAAVLRTALYETLILQHFSYNPLRKVSRMFPEMMLFILNNGVIKNKKNEEWV